MATITNRVRTIFEGQDKLTGVQKEASKGFNLLGKATNAFTGFLSNAASVATGFVAANVIGNLTGQLGEMIDRAQQAPGIAAGFERAFGDTEKSLQTLRDAAGGTISDFDLMLTSNKAALLGISNDTGDLAGLMTTARLRARELGIDATQAFDDIVTGIGRNSPLILDNLGIKIPDAIKATMENMTEAEKTQTLLSYAIQDGIDLAAEYGGALETPADRSAKLQTKFQNLKDEIGERLLPVWEGIIDIGARVLDIITPLIDQIGNFLTPIIGNLAGAFSSGEGPIGRFGEIIQSIGTILSDAFGIAQKSIEQAWPVIQPIFERIGDALGRISTVLQNIFLPVLDFVFNQIFKPIIEWVAAQAGPVLTVVFDAIARSLEFVAGVLEAVFNIAKPILETLFQIFSDVFNGIRSIVEGVFNAIRTTVETVFGGVVNIIKGIINGFIDIINVFIGGINEILAGLDSVAGVVGISVDFRLGEIGKLQTGTNYWPGGMAVMNEVGPEVAILPRGTRVRSYDGNEATEQIAGESGGGTTINNYNTFYEKVDMNRVASKLAFQLNS